MEIDPTWCPDLANLVEELVVHILEFLTPKEIYISSMTCKRFREIAKVPKLALVSYFERPKSDHYEKYSKILTNNRATI